MRSGGKAMVGIRLLVPLGLGAAACGSGGPKLTDTVASERASTIPGAALPAAATDAGVVVRVPIGTSPVRGPDDAWVTMVEFGDFECPFCGDVEPVLQVLLQEFSGDLRLVFKNLPLTRIHPYAMGAAIAAECADAQGDFWAMHDVLFANQNALQSPLLPGYAASAGVDVGQWQACLDTQPPVDAIGADSALASNLGIPGTPTFIVNGTMVVGAKPQSQLEALIAFKRSQAESSGVPRGQYYDQFFGSN